MSHVRQGFQSHKTLPLKYRQQQLRNLKRLIEENTDQLLQALHHDLHKVMCIKECHEYIHTHAHVLTLQSEAEALLMEIDFCMKDIDYALDNLEDWMAPKHKPRGLLNIGNKV